MTEELHSKIVNACMEVLQREDINLYERVKHQTFIFKSFKNGKDSLSMLKNVSTKEMRSIRDCLHVIA